MLKKLYQLIAHPKKPLIKIEAQWNPKWSDQVDHVFPAEGPSTASLAWWLPDATRKEMIEAERIEREKDREQQRSSPPISICGVPFQHSRSRIPGTVRLHYRDGEIEEIFLE